MNEYCTLMVRLPRRLVHSLNVLQARSCSSDSLVSMHKKSKSQKKKLVDIVTEMNYDKDWTGNKPVRSMKRRSNVDHSKITGVNAYVMGSGAAGSPKAFYVVTDRVGYLFNCGEMTQRMGAQLDLNLRILDNIFITNSVWENIGGIPGMALTRQDHKAEFLNIHGPLGIGKIFQSMKTFIVLHHIKTNIFETVKGESFNDGIMNIKYVPIYPSSSYVEPYFISSEAKIKEENESDTEDENVIDYYDYSRGSVEDNPSLEILEENAKSSANIEDKESKPSICYICKTPQVHGKIDLEACADRNLPAGPYFGKLKVKGSVKLPFGDVINIKEVKFPDAPGKTFFVVDCPSKKYLNSFLEEEAFREYQTPAVESDGPVLIVHFSHPSVMKDPKYIQWMESFPKTTKHLRLNEDNVDIGTPPIHQLQTKLNLVHPDIFPVLPNPGIPVLESSDELHEEDEEIDACLQDIAANFDVTFYEAMRKEFQWHKNRMKAEMLMENSVDLEQDVLTGKTSMMIDFKNFSVNYDPSFSLWPEECIQEALSEEGAPEALKDFKKDLSQLEPTLNATTEGDYPRFIFLGTGSSIPQSVRNTSGILIFTSEDSCMLFDCGEGTLNQFYIFFGKEKAEEVLLKLKAVYVSHMHADHHVGFLGILKGRRRAIDNYLEKMKFDSKPEFQGLSKAEILKKLNIKPLHLLGPNGIKLYLKLYHSIFEDVLDDFVLVSNSILKILFYRHKKEVSSISKFKVMRNLPPPEKVSSFLEDLHLKEFKTTHVRHCSDAYGVSFITNNNFKVTYSGDCMPSGNLIEIGQGSDLLIHEATFDYDRKPDASRKLHSTTDQAVEVGQKMGAKFTILTHFSQRYVYLPRCTELFSGNVGVAFDMMTFSMKQIPLLPKLMPMFRLIFAEKLRELDSKYFKSEYTTNLRQENNRKRTGGI